MTKKNEIEFGDYVQDRITGFKGIVVHRVEHLHGATQWGVQPHVDAEGKIQPGYEVDETCLEILQKQKAVVPSVPDREHLEIKLGDTAKDPISGMKGVVIKLITSCNGCTSAVLQTKGLLMERTSNIPAIRLKRLVKPPVEVPEVSKKAGGLMTPFDRS